MTATDLNLEFRTAILHNPDDNTVRLAYADYLDQTGNCAHAAFIRLQIARAGTSNKAGAREMVLFAYHLQEILGEITDQFCIAVAPEDACSSPCHGFPARGFIDTIRCRWIDWLEVAQWRVWKPGWTKPCDRCRDGTVSVAGGITEECDGVECEYCHGVGLVPRSPALTDQPVRRVEITDRPYLMVGFDGVRLPGLTDVVSLRVPGTAPDPTEDAGLRQALFALQWPGFAVEFAAPPYSREP